MRHRRNTDPAPFQDASSEQQESEFADLAEWHYLVGKCGKCERIAAIDYEKLARRSRARSARPMRIGLPSMVSAWRVTLE